jgi:hypothetical protein
MGRVLDHYDGFELSDIEVGFLSIPLNTLDRVWKGLDWMYQVVRDSESSTPRDGAGPVFQEHTISHRDFVFGAFQWYATSICQYVQTIGWLRTVRDDLGEEDRLVRANTYRDEVLPSISKFRNKVAGHYAFVDPRKTDNPAMRLWSVSQPLAWVTGRWMWAAALMLEQDGEKHEAGSDMRWALTEEHERLSARYSPPLTAT